ncbi:hypothetical protein DPEC_G00116030 [Dallia pectoralis]|uniref:Uncharacterized protein n=1 Tax=Dallia pectoralis TaxID=75939 RepID=A0ACC2GUJ9_DALPE|nr:hypothetical protein DPEC_G00116030 [Dallia pectoralis]
MRARGGVPGIPRPPGSLAHTCRPGAAADWEERSQGGPGGENGGQLCTPPPAPTLNQPKNARANSDTVSQPALTVTRGLAVGCSTGNIHKRTSMQWGPGCGERGSQGNATHPCVVL